MKTKENMEKGIKNNEKNRVNNIFYKLSPSGISLIVLVITIIVIIILAAAVILTLNKNNPIEEANRARYESDVANMQAIFTNVVTKVMAQNQGTIEVNAGELNSVKVIENGVSSVEGRVNYTLTNPQDSSNTNGTIIFNTGTNNATTYYTGRMLPLYNSGETTWYVDSQGIISLKVGKLEYGNGDKIEIPVEEEKEIVINQSDNPVMKQIRLNIFDILNASSGTITKVKFITADKVAKDKDNLRDISQAQDKSIMTWLEDNSRTLIIACREKIVANADSSFMFYNLNRLTTIENLELLDTSKVTNMSYMFCDCEKLTSLNLSNFNTENVINMSSMFTRCSSLEELDLSNFNTSKVTDMSGMFGRIGLTKLDLSNFDTSKVTNMSYMFVGIKVTNLDLSSFDTTSVTDMSGMFKEATTINRIILSEKFNTKNVTNMQEMFYYCYNLKSIENNTNFYISNSTNVLRMFRLCCNLTTTIVIDSANLKNTLNMFSEIESLDSAIITLNYTEGKSSAVDTIISQKPSTANIVKGVQV